MMEPKLINSFNLSAWIAPSRNFKPLTLGARVRIKVATSNSSYTLGDASDVLSKLKAKLENKE